MDALLDLNEPGSSGKDYTSYVTDLQERLQHTYGLVNEAMKDCAAKAKERYDMKVRGAIPEIGDQVLVKLVGLTGKQKLADKWEMEPYTVVEIPNKGMPVYVVRKSTGEGPKRTLHRNMLLPLALPLVDHRQEDPVEGDKVDGEDVTRNVCTRRSQGQAEPKSGTPWVDSGSSDDDDDFRYRYQVARMPSRGVDTPELRTQSSSDAGDPGGQVEVLVPDGDEDGASNTEDVSHDDDDSSPDDDTFVPSPTGDSSDTGPTDQVEQGNDLPGDDVPLLRSDDEEESEAQQDRGDEEVPTQVPEEEMPEGNTVEGAQAGIALDSQGSVGDAGVRRSQRSRKPPDRYGSCT